MVLELTLPSVLMLALIVPPLQDEGLRLWATPNLRIELGRLVTETALYLKQDCLSLSFFHS